MRRVHAGQSPIDEQERLSPEEVARERLVFALRMLEGVDRRAFHEQTGFTIDQLAADLVQQFIAHGLLEEKKNRIRLTRNGLLVSDSIWPYFL